MSNSAKEKLAEIIAEQNKMSDYINTVDFSENNLSFIVILGKRTIGKTHFILNRLYKECQEDNSAFLLLTRVKTQMSDVQAICSKYGRAISGCEWYYASGRIYEVNEIEEDKFETRVIGYVEYLNGADRGKLRNYDNPHVTRAFLDEVYTEDPVDGESRKLRKILDTSNRSLGRVTNNMVVYIAGNEDMGVAPILEDLHIDTNNNKWKSKNVLFYRNTLESLDDDANLKPDYIKALDNVKTSPLLNWTYNGVGYELHQLEHHLYVCESSKKGGPITSTTLTKIKQLLWYQRDYFKPIILETPRCSHLLVLCKFKRV